MIRRILKRIVSETIAIISQEIGWFRTRRFLRSRALVRHV